MRDLVRESGLPRETIHFYKLQGLLPEPIKTGRNTALYTQEHLERLRHIRELQERQFLPLKAIRAVLDETVDEGFTPEQEDLVRRVRATLGGWVHAQQSPTVAVADFVPARVPRQELRALVSAGLLQVHGTIERGLLSEDDAVILECWAQFKEAGLGPDRGVEPAEFRLLRPGHGAAGPPGGAPRAARLCGRPRGGNLRAWSNRPGRSSAGCSAPCTASACGNSSPRSARTATLPTASRPPGPACQAGDVVCSVYTHFIHRDRHDRHRRLRAGLVHRTGPDLRVAHRERPLGHDPAAPRASRAARRRR